MPLMKSKSKKAFEHNIEAEMHAGKPQDQALAIAYSVKKRAKKASGGTVESGSPTMNYAEGGDISASNEKRPMPENRYNDSSEASRNSGNKPASQDSWTDRPTERQAVANNSRRTMPIKHPKMVPSSVINARLRDQEDDLQSSAAPGSPDQQPARSMDEEDANKHGSDPDMAKPHTTAKAYAEGGSINGEVSFHDAEEDRDPNMSPIRESYMSPPEDEFMAGHFAEGGGIELEMMDQPEEEEHIDHDASVASAIMAKRRKFARGGEIMEEADPIRSHGSMDTHESADQADLSRNADEDANEEDQASWMALRKENYSESAGLDALDSPMDSAQKGHAEEDDHDRSIVGAIRRKMKSKSPISR